MYIWLISVLVLWLLGIEVFFIENRRGNIIFVVLFFSKKNFFFNLQQNLIFGYKMLSSRVASSFYYSIHNTFIVLLLFQSTVIIFIKPQFIFWDIENQIFELATSFRRNVRKCRRDYPTQKEETKGTPSPLFVKYNFYIDNEQANISLRSICQFFKVLVRLASNYSRLAYHKQSYPCSNNKEQESCKKHIIVSLRWP